MDTLIDKIGLNDLPRVSALSEQLGYPASLEELTARFPTLDHSPLHGLFLYRKGDEVLGWMHIEIVLDLLETTKVEIKAIVVDEKSRGEGVGKKLIDYAKRWALLKSIDTIFLSCNIIREQTHKFYQREGFTINRTSHFFEQKL